MNKTELLKEVWNTCTFNEIIDAGFELNKCGAIDLKVAANEFVDPERELDITDEELTSVIEDRGVNKIVDILKDKFSISNILEEFDVDDIIDAFGADIIIFELEKTGNLDTHDDDIRSQQYQECINEWNENLNDEYDKQILKLKSGYPDELRTFFCNLFEIGYYDEDGLFNGFIDLFNKMENSIYKRKGESKWLLTKE